MLTERQKLYIRLNWPNETVKELFNGCTIREYDWQLPASPREIREYVLSLREEDKLKPGYRSIEIKDDYEEGTPIPNRRNK